MVAITDRANTGVTAISGGSYRVVKIGGGGGSFDAAAASVAGIAGDFTMRARRVGTTARLMVAVTADPDEEVGYTGLDYSMQFLDDSLQVFERGAYRTATTSDVFVWIDRTGTTLRYLTGPRHATAAVIRSVADVSATLFFDCSLFTAGAAVDVRFDAPGSWVDGHRAASRRHLAIGLAL